jgi:hypothetical protein
MVDEVTAEYVLAQWAYSELNSPEQGDKYAGVDELRGKQARNVPFARLSERERALLLSKWQEVRGFAGSIFAVALAGIRVKRRRRPAREISTRSMRSYTGWCGSADYLINHVSQSSQSFGWHDDARSYNSAHG